MAEALQICTHAYMIETGVIEIGRAALGGALDTLRRDDHIKGVYFGMSSAALLPPSRSCISAG